jgi:hypothetical protein
MKRDRVFDLRYDDHSQSWAALRDLDRLAKACDFEGFVLLVDEFEDVLHNLRNEAFERTAMSNLLRFFDAPRGLAYFAITPDFSGLGDWQWIDDSGRGHRFQELPSIALPPVEADDAIQLLRRVVAVYGAAYSVDAEGAMGDRLDEIIHKARSGGQAAWLRLAIADLIARLDRVFS